MQILAALIEKTTGKNFRYRCSNPQHYQTIRSRRLKHFVVLDSRDLSNVATIQL
jgi:hypothetical protein